MLCDVLPCAVGRPYREIAQWLTDQHGVSAWWAQKIAVEYEQERGVRDPGAGPDGTFAAGASKTVAAAAGENKSQVAVEHERLADAAAVEATKTFWRERLTALKGLLEA